MEADENSVPNEDTPNTAPSSEDNKKNMPEWLLAKEGIRLLINNNPEEAEQLFKQYPDSLLMFAGYSFAIFMDALMTFEDDKLNLATTVLKELERKCNAESGWFKSMKWKMFSSQESQQTLARDLETQIILADSQLCLATLTFLQSDISGYFKGGWVLRKSWKIYQNVYNDILLLYKEKIGDLDLPVVIENSTSSLAIQRSSGMPTSSGGSRKDSIDSERSKSSGVHPPSVPINGYTKPRIPYSHSAILTNHADATGCSSGNSTPNSMKNNYSQASYSGSISSSNSLFLKKSSSVDSALSKYNNNRWSSKLSPLTSSFTYLTSKFNIFSSTEKLKSANIDRDSVERLMATVSFGYGVFQLGISLLPASLFRLTNLLGFGGNRHQGIECLMFARLGVDMRAPLATLALLWYHTIVRPFYAIDGNNIQAGVHAASQLLDESDEEYSQSALFLFFKGRVCRLNSDIPAALKSYQAASEAANQREVKLLSMHETGWCHLIQLDYCAAQSTFHYLRLWSRWSRGFYSYLMGICSGSCEKSSNLRSVLEDMKTTIKSSNKGNQLDVFLARRDKCCPDVEEELANLKPLYWKLLVYEILYLWNSLPSCSRQKIENIKADCATFQDEGDVEPLVGLRKFIMGCCYSIQKHPDEAIANFKECLDARKNLPNIGDDAHISAFALYELGALLVKTEETVEEGKLMLKQISSYKDYNFEQRLNVRVHSLLKHL